MTALNWGNLDNRDRLTHSQHPNGKTWNAAQVQAVVETLDATDKAYVEGVWKQIDTHWPEIEAMERRINGVVPTKVEAEPFTTATGEWSGGYFPIVYDSSLSIGADAKQAEQQADLYRSGGAVSKNTAHGHRKARGGGLGRPLKMDLSVISQHLRQVNHDLTHHELVMDLLKIYGDRDVQSALQQVLPMVEAQGIGALIEDIATGGLNARDMGQKIVSWARRGVSIYYLGMSVMQSALNITNLSVGAQRVGPKRYLATMLDMFGNKRGPEGRLAFIRESSSFMRVRERTSNRQVAEAIDRIKGKDWKENIEHIAYWMNAKTDFLTASVTWLAEFDRASEQSDMTDAVAQADQAVLDAHGGGETKDLSPLQRSVALQIFTPFMGYGIIIHNRLSNSIDQWRQHPASLASTMRVALDMALLLALPAAITIALRHLLLPSGGGGDDGDDEAQRLAKEWAKELLGQAAMGNLLARELSSAATEPYGYRGPTGTLLVGEGYKLVQQAAQGELDKALIKAAAGTVGMALGLPGGQVIKSIEGAAWAEENGDWRAVITGKPRQ